MIVWCKKCHREAARIIKQDGQIKVMRGKSNLITMLESGNMEGNTVSVKCPNNHDVKLKL